MACTEPLVRGGVAARFAPRGVFGVVLIALLAACAPRVQAPFDPPHDYRGPAFEEAVFRSFDGAALRLQSWTPPEGQEPWAVIIALHGMNDYSEAFYLAGPAWAAQGAAVYAYDQRGFGASPHRGVWPGERLLVEDLRTAAAVARRRHPNATIAVVGDSMGAAVAIAAFGSARPPDADRLILVAPAVWGWSSLPDLYALTLRLTAWTIPGRPVSPPRGVQRRITPSDNEEMLRKIGADPLMLFETRIDALYGLVSLMETASRRIAAVQAPTLFLYGEKDQIIPRRAAERAATALPAGGRSLLYEDGYHMLLRDRQAAVVHADVLAFIADPARPAPSGAPTFALANR